MRRPFVLAVLLAIAFTSTAGAARPSFAYEVVVEEPKTLQDVLRDRLGYGWTCAAVARPVGVKLATSVAVVLTQEAGADVPLKRDVRVITSTPDGVDELARRLDASAAQGFGRLRAHDDRADLGTARRRLRGGGRPHTHGCGADRRDLPRGPLDRPPRTSGPNCRRPPPTASR